VKTYNKHYFPVLSVFKVVMDRFLSRQDKRSEAQDNEPNVTKPFLNQSDRAFILFVLFSASVSTTATKAYQKPSGAVMNRGRWHLTYIKAYSLWQENTREIWNGRTREFENFTFKNVSWT